VLTRNRLKNTFVISCFIVAMAFLNGWPITENEMMLRKKMREANGETVN
jgi:hypothetical protein